MLSETKTSRSFLTCLKRPGSNGWTTAGSSIIYLLASTFLLKTRIAKKPSILQLFRHTTLKYQNCQKVTKCSYMCPINLASQGNLPKAEVICLWLYFILKCQTAKSQLVILYMYVILKWLMVDKIEEVSIFCFNTKANYLCIVISYHFVQYWRY